MINIAVAPADDLNKLIHAIRKDSKSRNIFQNTWLMLLLCTASVYLLFYPRCHGGLLLFWPLGCGWRQILRCGWTFLTACAYCFLFSTCSSIAALWRGQDLDPSFLTLNHNFTCVHHLTLMVKQDGQSIRALIMCIWAILMVYLEVTRPVSRWTNWFLSVMTVNSAPYM